METIIISDHAFKRWRERKNLTYNISISKIARQAYTKGLDSRSYIDTAFGSWITYSLRKYPARNRFIKVYKNYVFVYAKVGDGILLVTVMEVPEKFYYIKNYAIMK